MGRVLFGGAVLVAATFAARPAAITLGLAVMCAVSFALGRATG